MGSDAVIGDVVAQRYRLESELGRGGMATVFHATDTKLNRSVAIKILHTDLARQPNFRTRFRQEARAAARLTHPNVVRVFDAGESSDPGDPEAVWPFIVMEHIDGKLLSDIIRRGPLSVEDAVDIQTQLLTALGYAHDSGLIHRDVKPSNIMLTPDGVVKVMDFGIARSVDEVADTVARTTNILGTAAYFSPEQARGEAVSERSDVYSAGIVLFEMLTGRVPFQDVSPVRVAYQHVSEPAPAPSTLNSAVNPGIDEVVARALHKNPIERFQTAADFTSALEMARLGQPIDPFLPGDAERFVSQFAVTELSESELALRQLAEADDTGVEVKRPPLMWLWAGGALIFGLVFAVLFWALTLAPAGTVASSQRTIPDVSGLTQAEASDALKKLDLSAMIVPTSDPNVELGKAIRTNPRAGEVITEGAKVTLYVSTGKAQIAVPNVDSLPVDKARAALTAAGFVVGTETAVGSPSLAAGTVVTSDPAAGTEIAAGSTVNLKVSTGKVNVPSVVGQPLSDASALLRGTDYRLTVEPVPDSSCKLTALNPVVAQSVGPGAAPQGSAIKLTFCAG